MAETILQLEVDPETGRKQLVVKHISDEDLLPHEHEEEHRAVVDKVFEGKGKIEAVDGVVVRRDPAGNVKLDLPQDEAEEEQQGISEGS